MFEELILVRGGGDLGSGVAVRLWRAGFDVVILDTPRPIAVRRTVSFSEAVYTGSQTVEEVTGVLIESVNDIGGVVSAGRLPVLVDPTAASLPSLRPEVVVDAILAKRNSGTYASMARLVIGLGPGFSAGDDVHAVVETNRGPNLGRVIWWGPAEADTGEPGLVRGHAASRVLRAPVTGLLRSDHAIGDIIEEGQTIGEVNGECFRAGFTGTLRGLLRDDSEVEAGMKIGDLDPRLDPGLCRHISDKSLAVAGGVLEAVLSRLHGRLALR